MPKAMAREEKLELERAILPAREVGEYEWPIAVEALGQTARLRLAKGATRISYDWIVPEKYHEVLDLKRVNRQVPAPDGKLTEAAKLWTREWLRKQVNTAERKLDGNGSGATTEDREGPNDVPLRRVLERFRESERLGDIREDNPQQADEIERWMDFYLAVLGADWRFYNMSSEVLSRLMKAYQQPWERTYADGRTEITNSDLRARHNTAAKAVGYLRTIAGWAVGQPEGPGQFLLDSDPYARIQQDDIPKEHDIESRSVGVAPDPYVEAMYRQAWKRGRNGQFGLMFSGELATGRRVGDWRQAERGHVMTDLDSVRTAIEEQKCRLVLPDDHIPDEELDEAAEAYFGVSGVVMRFPRPKQVASDPVHGPQHDRVIPLGPWMAEHILMYLEEYWGKFGLTGDSAPLCPAEKEPSQPTSKDLVQTWWGRTEHTVATQDEDLRIPAGRTHTLRRRARAKLRRHDTKSLYFYAGWSIRGATAADRSYLPVHWQDVVDIALVCDNLLTI